MNYFNRELSWLSFNQRVLEEAYDEKNPLLERAKFLGIVCSNLDEFFMVRVASLIDQVYVGYKGVERSGLSPKKQLKKISRVVHEQVENVYTCWNEKLLPEMLEQGIYFVSIHDLTDEQERFLESYFTRYIFPVVTPMAIDQSRPFPLLLNKSLNLGILLQPELQPEGRQKTETDMREEGDLDDEPLFAVVKVPAETLPRFLEIPDEGRRCFVLLEKVIIYYLERLFQGYKIMDVAPFRITRHGDISVAEEGAEDLLNKIESLLKLRKRGATIRLEIDRDADQRLVDYFKTSLAIDESDIYRVSGPLDLSFLIKFRDISGFKKLRYPDFQPAIPVEFARCEDIFGLIRERDRLLHHPYESFQPVIDFVNEAAEDPHVLAIKITLYRVSGDSPVVAALARAAENDKQVTVVVELKARFDEANNIQWARKLEEAGCHVIYGPAQLKVHCKTLLVVRREDDGIRRYLHLGTGNYNDETARVYTDMGLFTCDEYLGADISALFNNLTGYCRQKRWYKLIVSPEYLYRTFNELIENEIKCATENRPARIIAQMNSLVDARIIKHLYRASQAGVRIDLIVRGICCLVPGVPGISDNIRVISIVGRYLEHSRIFYFYNGDRFQMILGSADWMPRNFNRRVEVAFAIEDEDLKKRLLQILQIFLQDNVKARELRSDGSYQRLQTEQEELLNSQEVFQKLAHEANVTT